MSHLAVKHFPFGEPERLIHLAATIDERIAPAHPRCSQPARKRGHDDDHNWNVALAQFHNSMVADLRDRITLHLSTSSRELKCVKMAFGVTWISVEQQNLSRASGTKPLAVNPFPGMNSWANL